MIAKLQLIVFIIGTIANIIFSWRTFARPYGHGFYRFFVFQGIIFLIYLNLPFWFHRPLAAQQLVSWTLLMIAIVYAVAGFYYLLKFGQPRAKALPDSSYTFERTTVLVEKGWYRYIRHPMYGSLLLLAWGAALKRITLFSVLGLILTTIFVCLTAMVEEKENLRTFGAAYAAYMRHSKRFIPFLW